ncbi:MAG TPA: diguanylate cyclase [Solirubrobacteraceae bacterium]
MVAVLGVGSLLLTAFVLRALTGFGGAPTQRLFATWISDAIVLSAVTVCLWRALQDRRDRTLWGLAGLGMASWGLGNSYFEHMLASGASLPNPSPADMGYLGFYPLVYLAVIAARRRPGEPLGVGLWLDGMIGAAACATLGAAVVLEPVLHATQGESLAGALTNIAYPIGDLTLLTMLVVTTATVGWRGARGLAPLAAGMALFALSDTLYLVENANDSYQTGGILDAGWLLALMLMAGGAAALSRTGRRPTDHKQPRSANAVVPSLAGVLALAVLGLQPLTEANTTSVAFAILTLTLVITRMAISLRETARLLIAREREAALDPLTGLANRRVLLSDLSRHAADATTWEPTLLLLFDLDGFKIYNDTFGHSAGDSLLIQVATSLSDAVGRRGRSYRLGGDEFCALLSVTAEQPERVGEELAAAMSQHGEGFLVTASYGCALTPADGRDSTALLRRADDEMYARKGRRRPGTENQVQDALIAALCARDPGMESHATSVATLATALGERLGLSASELRALSHAAALHDVGKIAIPDELLDKPTELDAHERRFLQTHPLIAQRIVAAAPALGYAAQIVRSVQERWDGAGYPDGLSADAIPLASRVIGVCNAYNAMTSDRPHRQKLSSEQAIAELQRCAGTQFDPDLAATLVELLTHPSEPPTTPPAPEEAADLLASRESAARRRLEAELSYQVDHDPLTGLLNRKRFADELERMLRYASRYSRKGALLMLDLDNLKLVNDVHGHSAGDDAVRIVARELLGRTRATDFVARLGGDEFAVALHEADEPRAIAVAEDIRERLAGCEIHPQVRISVGIALFDGGEELVADDLLTAADLALYDAKKAGRGQIRVYRGDTGAALGWVQRIRDALTEERFVLYAQPIVDLRAGRQTHRELLVRMLSDDGDAIPPDAFIPTAERFGLISDIDRWVMSQGLSLARRGKGVSINLSAHSIGDPHILELVRAAARKDHLGSGRVIFEITETAAMTNMQDARVFTQALKQLGCDVALDDFGTGFGSFSYLKHLPSRYLKIDVEFVRDLTSNATDQHVVRSITDVGHSLDKLIIAEGVEDRAILDALRAYGVDYAQGFYLGAPRRISAPTKLEKALRASRAHGVEKAK